MDFKKNDDYIKSNFKKYDDYIKSRYGEGAEATASVQDGSKKIISYILLNSVGVKEEIVTEEEWKVFEFIKNNKEYDE